MDLTLMGRRDARRLGVVQAAVQGKLTSREGAEALGLSVRQFKRLRAQVRQRGAAGVVHGNRGRPSSRRLRPALRERVEAMLTGLVKLNDHHLADLLDEQGHAVSAATVRRVRCGLKLAPKRRRRPPQHRRRRERAGRPGALVLIDGSPFHWFDAAGPPCTLLGAIDDATSQILALTFRPTEDLHGYAVLLRQLLGAHGVPVALYGDRSGVLVRNDAHWTLAEELAGHQTPSQFGQMLAELGVRFIAATSPQAKGRIERLWGTLQDRLASELRLHGHATVAAATAYLPGFIHRHNRRRGCAPAHRESAFRPPPRDLDHLIACRYPRVVARDNTVTIPGRWAQVPPGPHRRSWHKARVEVRELLDGRLLVLHPTHGLIGQQPAPDPAFTLESRGAPRSRRARATNGCAGSCPSPDRPAPRPATRPRSPALGALTQIRRPAATHPWKRYTGPEPLRRKAGAERVTESLTR
jgi:transposase